MSFNPSSVNRWLLAAVLFVLSAGAGVFVGGRALPGQVNGGASYWCCLKSNLGDDCQELANCNDPSKSVFWINAQPAGVQQMGDPGKDQCNNVCRLRRNAAQLPNLVPALICQCDFDNKNDPVPGARRCTLEVKNKGTVDAKEFGVTFSVENATVKIWRLDAAGKEEVVDATDDNTSLTVFDKMDVKRKVIPVVTLAADKSGAGWQNVTIPAGGRAALGFQIVDKAGLVGDTKAQLNVVIPDPKAGDPNPLVDLNLGDNDLEKVLIKTCPDCMDKKDNDGDGRIDKEDVGCYPPCNGKDCPQSITLDAQGQWMTLYDGNRSEKDVCVDKPRKPQTAASPDQYCSFRFCVDPGAVKGSRCGNGKVHANSASDIANCKRPGEYVFASQLQDATAARNECEDQAGGYYMAVEYGDPKKPDEQLGPFNTKFVCKNVPILQQYAGQAKFEWRLVFAPYFPYNVKPVAQANCKVPLDCGPGNYCTDGVCKLARSNKEYQWSGYRLMDEPDNIIYPDQASCYAALGREKAAGGIAGVQQGGAGGVVGGLGGLGVVAIGGNNAVGGNFGVVGNVQGGQGGGGKKPKGGKCTQNADCASNKCIRGICAGAGIAPGQEPGNGGRGTPNGEACLDDNDCFVGLKCIDNLCQADGGAGGKNGGQGVAGVAGQAGAAGQAGVAGQLGGKPGAAGQLGGPAGQGGQLGLAIGGPGGPGGVQAGVGGQFGGPGGLGGGPAGQGGQAGGPAGAQGTQGGAQGGVGAGPAGQSGQATGSPAGQGGQPGAPAGAQGTQGGAQAGVGAGPAGQSGQATGSPVGTQGTQGGIGTNGQNGGTAGTNGATTGGIGGTTGQNGTNGGIGSGPMVPTLIVTFPNLVGVAPTIETGNGKVFAAGEPIPLNEIDDILRDPSPSALSIRRGPGFIEAIGGGTGEQQVVEALITIQGTTFSDVIDHTFTPASQLGSGSNPQNGRLDNPRNGTWDVSPGSNDDEIVVAPGATQAELHMAYPVGGDGFVLTYPPTQLPSSAGGSTSSDIRCALVQSCTGGFSCIAGVCVPSSSSGNQSSVDPCSVTACVIGAQCIQGRCTRNTSSAGGASSPLLFAGNNSSDAEGIYQCQFIECGLGGSEYCAAQVSDQYPAGLGCTEQAEFPCISCQGLPGEVVLRPEPINPAEYLCTGVECSYGGNDFCEAKGLNEGVAERCLTVPNSPCIRCENALLALAPIAPPSPLCGNGRVDAGESCDPGGTPSANGCTESCLLGSNQQCVQNEECESGNCIRGACVPCNTNKDCKGTNICVNHSCGTLCGNGRQDIGEACDDGNRTDTDQCSNSCLLNTSVACTADRFCASGLCAGGQCVTCTSGNQCGSAICASGRCITTCGNGQMDAGEYCDDGNKISGDGCSRACYREQLLASGVAAEITEFDVIGAVVQGAAPVLHGVATPYQQQLQQIQQQQQAQQQLQAQSIATSRAPAGKTGPATLAVIASGAAFGWSFVRRRRRS